MNIPYALFAVIAVAVIYLLAKVSKITRDHNRLLVVVEKFDPALERLDLSCGVIKNGLESLALRLPDDAMSLARPKSRVSPARKPKRKNPSRTRH